MGRPPRARSVTASVITPQCWALSLHGASLYAVPSPVCVSTPLSARVVAAASVHFNTSHGCYIYSPDTQNPLSQASTHRTREGKHICLMKVKRQASHAHDRDPPSQYSCCNEHRKKPQSASCASSTT